MRVTSHAEAPYRELHVSQCEISTVWLPWRDGDIMLPCGKKNPVCISFFIVANVIFDMTSPFLTLVLSA